MPATILSLLAIWSSLLLPGAASDHRAVPSSGLAWCHSMLAVTAPHSTIQASPIDRSNPWLATDATAEDEEESSDGDDNVIVAELHWTLDRLKLDGQASTRQLDRGYSICMLRSTILRC